MPNTKGENFRVLARCIRTLRGDEVADAVLKLVPTELAEGLRLGSIVPGGWYPLVWYSELHRACSRVTGEGLPLARELGRESTRHLFSGPYRFFKYVLSPQSIVSLGQRAFSLFFDTGKVTILEARAGFVRCELTGCEGYDPWLWEDLIGANETLILLAGGKNPRPRILGGGGNLPNIRLEYTWE